MIPIKDNPLTLSEFTVYMTHEVSKCKAKRCGICNIIIEEKSYTFKNSKTIFIMNRNLNSKSKNIVYVIKCTNWHEI